MRRVWNLYSRCLQERPFATNVATVSVLLIGGDYCAQRIEFKHHSDDLRALAQLQHLKQHEHITSSVPALAPLATEPGHALSKDDSTEHADATFFTDKQRSLRMLSWGFIAGPTTYWWYANLDRMIQGTDWKSVIKKVTVTQTTWGPFYQAMFFGFVLASKRIAHSLEGSPTISGVGAATVLTTPEDVGFLSLWKEKLKQDLLRTSLNSVWFWGLSNGLNFAVIPPKFRVVWVSSTLLAWTVYLSVMGHKRIEALEEDTILIEDVESE